MKEVDDKVREVGDLLNFFCLDPTFSADMFIPHFVQNLAEKLNAEKTSPTEKIRLIQRYGQNADLRIIQFAKGSEIICVCNNIYYSL